MAFVLRVKKQYFFVP